MTVSWIDVLTYDELRVLRAILAINRFKKHDHTTFSQKFQLKDLLCMELRAHPEINLRKTLESLTQTCLLRIVEKSSVFYQLDPDSVKTLLNSRVRPCFDEVLDYDSRNAVLLEDRPSTVALLEEFEEHRQEYEAADMGNPNRPLSFNEIRALKAVLERSHTSGTGNRLYSNFLPSYLNSYIYKKIPLRSTLDSLVGRGILKMRSDPSGTWYRANSSAMQKIITSSEYEIFFEEVLSRMEFRPVSGLAGINFEDLLHSK